MAEPATPTPSQRAATRALAAAVVSSVERDMRPVFEAAKAWRLERARPWTRNAFEELEEEGKAQDVLLAAIDSALAADKESGR